MFLTFSQLPNKYIIKSNKTQIHQNPNSQYPTKKNSSNQRSTQNQRTTKREPPTPPQQQQENQRSKRASRSAMRSTQSKQIGDSAGWSRVWRMGLTNGEEISGFATIGDEWVWRFLGLRFEEWVRRRDLSLSLSLCLRVWVLPSLALSLSLWALLDKRARSWVFWVRQSSWMWIDLAFACARVLVRSLFLAVFLSFLFSWGGSDLKWKWERKLFFALLALFYSQTENIFSLTEFSVTAKHPLFRKSISGISLKPKQTEPKCLY